jgi:hypothetical protein
LVLIEVSRLGEVVDEMKEEEADEFVKEKGVMVADEEVKVVEDRRRLLVAPRVKRNTENQSRELFSRTANEENNKDLLNPSPTFH